MTGERWRMSSGSWWMEAGMCMITNEEDMITTGD
jgi:hypothetical protein